MSQGQLPLRNSKFHTSAQELLNELCSLGSNDYDAKRPKGQKGSKGQEDEKRNGSAASSSKQEQSLQLLELVELQRRKAKLLAMLEEVDRRYRHYCSQMKAVVTSFELVAGVGSATVYSVFASKAMSRHFRCLRDGIVGQLQVTRKAMEEPVIKASINQTMKVKKSGVWAFSSSMGQSRQSRVNVWVSENLEMGRLLKSMGRQDRRSSVGQDRSDQCDSSRVGHGYKDDRFPARAFPRGGIMPADAHTNGLLGPLFEKDSVWGISSLEFRRSNRG
ncbi:hypothetical protein MLD38_034292 [Melastoma candidum]|uniref:Uncharacterized protein n=1 Tax=Melastoma candidum TaxID=119954 RepID=A0ACB9MD82_9MYRT|nr:hypothetical protein MLD38_034292 [Melastoma candidum]